MFEIDLSETLTTYPCPDCGGTASTAWGWIHEGEQAHAAYFAGLLVAHPEKRPIMLTISIGPWGNDADAADRHMVFMEVRPKDNGETWAMMVRNASESRYSGELVLGVPLSRAEALEWSGLQAAYALADFVIAHDPAVRSFLRSGKVDTKGRKPTGPE